MSDLALPPTSSTGPSRTGAAAPDRLQDAAREFEAVFLAQVLGTLNQGLGADGPLGGDPVFGDMLNQELAKLISRTGGIGVADAVLQEMLKMQEVA
jgi:flagellar protein FlgJ